MVGVTVRIYVDGSQVASATTDANGYYSKNIYISTLGSHTLKATAIGVSASRTIYIYYDPVPGSISVYAPSGVYTGDTFKIYGYVKDQYGNPYYSGPVTVTVAGQTHTTYGSSSTGYYSVDTSIPTAGTYTIRASAGSVSATRSIQVVAPEPEPPYVNSVTISAPSSAEVNQSFTISGYVKDQYGNGVGGVTVKLYKSDILFASIFTDSSGGYSKSTSIGTAGTYTLKAVADSKQATRSITITTPPPPPPPPLAATLTASPTTGQAPLAVTFTIGISGGYTPYTWSLDPGDGSTPYTGSRSSSGSFTRTHTYTKVGTFTATLTVTDALGASAVKRTTTHPGAVSPGKASAIAIAAPLLTGAALIAASRKL